MIEEERARLIQQMILSEPAAARITPELMADVLKGCDLRPLRGAEWFADTIRPIIYIAARQRLPKGNAEIRDDLLSFASRLRDLFMDSMAVRRDAGDECLAFAQELESRRGEFWPKHALAAFYNPESLVWLAKFYEHVAERYHAQRQPPKWRAKARRDARVSLAMQLTAVFEEGFGRRATLNKWPSGSQFSSFGAWADFYQRVMGEALGERATPDLEGVLTEARKRLTESGYSPGYFIRE